MTETMEQLQMDIAMLQSTILGLEVRLARKQIALEEAVQSHAARLSANQQPVVEPPSLTVIKMVESVLLGIDGSVSYKTLRKRVLMRYPYELAKIRVGIYRACAILVAGGKPIIMPEPTRWKNRLEHLPVNGDGVPAQ